MSENWQIVIVTGVLGWIAYELRALRAELGKFVTRHDCEKEMDGHCGRLDTLTAKVEFNETEIEKLKAKTEVWHNG